ncbi:phage tail tube protein, partial [Thomasclavelia cocleata]|uniref:phage tail tube protein n=1 Tax=Thomasclavelia cocleata TaxID=69824 RepID=UPI0034E3EF44
PGNDMVAGLISKNGRDVEKPFTWIFPDGSKIEFANAVINVTNVGAGDSTGVAPLEFEVMSNGKPTFTQSA